MCDVEGLNIYVLDSFDTMATLLSEEATFVATKIRDFNKQKLVNALRIASGEDEFAEIFIPLVNDKFDMYNLRDISDGLGITIPARDPDIHPTWDDLEVRRRNIEPVSITPGSYAVICKYAIGCSWDVEWWFIKIVPKSMPAIHKDIYEQEFMQSWDNIRQMLLVDNDRGSLPRDNFETLIDFAYEMGYKKALGL